MKNIKQAFQSIASKVTNQPKGCVQCNDDDCAKCKGNQHSYNYVFGEMESQPQPPAPRCFNYLKIVDNWCYGFNPGECEWSIDDGVNGLQTFSSGWDFYMSSFYPEGSGGSYAQFNCNGVNGTYILRCWTETPLTLSMNVVDGFCNSYNLTGGSLCQKTCYTLTMELTSAFDRGYMDIYPFNTIEFFYPPNPISSPGAFNGYVTNILQQIWGLDAYSTISTNGNFFTLNIYNVYCESSPMLYIENLGYFNFDVLTC